MNDRERAEKLRDAVIQANNFGPGDPSEIILAHDRETRRRALVEAQGVVCRSCRHSIATLNTPDQHDTASAQSNTTREEREG
jgi:hypothetical protein